MTISQRDRRALIFLAAALIVVGIVRFGFTDKSSTAVSASSDNAALLQQRLVRLRQVAAIVPAREAMLKQATSDLADRERGILQADTAAQAEATLLEVARRVGKTEQIDVRGGDFGAPKSVGDYGFVYATVVFECHIEQLVNFLADLARETELIIPAEERITAGNPKEKTMGVRMVLAGVVAKKLVPGKKGPAGL